MKVKNNKLKEVKDNDKEIKRVGSFDMKTCVDCGSHDAGIYVWIKYVQCKTCKTNFTEPPKPKCPDCDNCHGYEFEEFDLVLWKTKGGNGSQ